MKRSMKTAATLAILVFPLLAVRANGQESLQPLFKNYCTQCHGAEKQKGDVRLDDVAKIDPKLWKTIYEQLASGEMPPDDKSQPKDSERKLLMDHALLAATKDQPVTAPGFRRLNQREYSHTVRDLLGLRKGTFDPGEYIYKDEVTDGFDTEAGALVISNELLLEYLRAGEKSLRQALFTADTARPPVRDVAVNVSRMQGIGGDRYITDEQESHHHAQRRQGDDLRLQGQRARWSSQVATPSPSRRQAWIGTAIPCGSRLPRGRSSWALASSRTVPNR